MRCILNVGTVPMRCILNVGTVPMRCILYVGTVPMFNLSHKKMVYKGKKDEKTPGDFVELIFKDFKLINQDRMTQQL